MSDPGQRLARLRGHLEPPWTEARAARVRVGITRRQQRARALRIAACLLLVLGLGLGLALGPELRGRGGEVRFADGSVARPIEAGSAIRPLPAPAGLVAVALDRGAARFRVAPDRRRVFRVESGAVTIEALGTAFVVSRRGAKVAVSVEEGQVRVRWLGGEEVLAAGSAATFPRDAAPGASSPAAGSRGVEGPAHAPAAAGQVLIESPSGATAAAPGEAPPAARGPARPEAPSPLSTRVGVGSFGGTSPRPAHRPREVPSADDSAPPERPAPSPAERPRWQDLAQEGDYDRAFALLRDGAGPRDDPQELLLAADVARLSRHAEAALAPLQQTVDHHSADPRAPLAAFTLGRVLLDGLGRPRQAAAAFRAAQELHPDGPLAQDALAREVEAWSRADEARVARQRALEYLRRYPAGPRQRAVRRHGGLE